MSLCLTAPEVRTFAALELRAESVGGRYTSLSGRAVPYNEWTNVGWYAEQFEPGALDKSIEEAARALPLLMFHDSKTWPIGAASDWQPDKAGLNGVWELDDSAEAQRAADLADKGFLTGMSIGFVPIRQTWEFVDDWNPDLGLDHVDKVTRHEARLVEVSLTPTPAYAGAVVELVRSGDRGGRRRGVQRCGEVAAWRAYLDTVRTAV